jgi:microcystin degradation protein MlrC
MRIVTGGIAQETNTFQHVLTTLDDFSRPGFGMIVRGKEILGLEGTGTVYGGVLAAASAEGVELVPTIYAEVMPGGRVSRDAFDTLGGELLEGIRAALPVDGVLLVLHGSDGARGSGRCGRAADRCGTGASRSPMFQS